MILIDAVYINNGGGKILLDILVSELIKNDTDEIYFLFDLRIKNQYKKLKIKNSTFLYPNLLLRHIFYLKNKKKITKIFAFANIPPTLKMKCDVITYFHNVTLIDDTKPTLSLYLKRIIFNFLRNNTNYWYVQTNSVKNYFEKKFNFNNVLVLPFYKNIKNTNNVKGTNNFSFLYVSNGEVYKNHERLFKAFQIYNRENPSASLYVTINYKYLHLINLIDKFINEGVNIINKYFENHDDLINFYPSVSFIIYPSLKESFGLGLIEAAQFEKPIIASDLDYVYDVVQPNEVFNPYEIESILNSFRNSNSISSQKSVLKVGNKCSIIVDKILNN